MDVKEQIMDFVKNKGPVLPVQIAKEIQSNILMASAHLSELVSDKKLKISYVKVGGSPLYFFPGQEPKLQQYSNNLNEREKDVYNLLNQKKILRNTELEPAFRVAISQIKDYAVPLQVNHKGTTEIFWKWYLLPTAEAENLIREKIKLIKPTEKKIEEPKKIIKSLEKIKKREEPKDYFLNQINAYFNRNKIEVLEKTALRKNSELDFIIRLPSTVGKLTYFCKAKNKRKINDGDLSSAYIQSQSKKLPVLFLTKGDLTKKAKDMLEKEFRGMSIKKI